MFAIIDSTRINSFEKWIKFSSLVSLAKEYWENIQEKKVVIKIIRWTKGNWFIGKKLNNPKDKIAISKTTAGNVFKRRL